jgi:hypothetical protein
MAVIMMVALIIGLLMLFACGIVTGWPRLPGSVTPAGLRPVE